MQVQRTQDWFITLTFTAAIGLACLGSLSGRERSVAEIQFLEKRTPEPLPALPATWSDLRRFPDRFDGYFKDAFGFRAPLIRSYNHVKFYWLGVSPSPKVLAGENGWLFLADGDLVDSYRNARPLPELKLRELERTLVQNNAWLARHGIRYLFVVAPNKQSIYPEHLPDRFNRIGNQSRLDQLMARLESRGQLASLDLRGALIAEKGRARSYEKTGTHWNSWGAFAAHRAIVKRLSHWFPGLTPRALAEYELTYGDDSGDLGVMIQLWNRLTEPTPVLTPRFPACARTPEGPLTRDIHLDFTRKNLATTCDAPELPRAVMFRDSFANPLIPFLSENFSEIIYVWGAFDPELLTKLLEQGSVDVVIEEVVERSIR